MSKSDNKIKKLSETKFPPIIAKKDVIQCMYCKYYGSYSKECRLYSDHFPMKRKPQDFCSYGTISKFWLEQMGYTQEEIQNMQNIQNAIDTQDEDILKEILK